jgi:hypothetical protein
VRMQSGRGGSEWKQGWRGGGEREGREGREGGGAGTFLIWDDMTAFD